jgi:hypothetical protein
MYTSSRYRSTVYEEAEGGGVAKLRGGNSNMHTIAAESSLRKLSKMITFQIKFFFSRRLKIP